MMQAPSVNSIDLVTLGTFETIEQLPDNSDKLIAIASDIVMHAVKSNYKPSSAHHVLAVKKAICMQVSYWFENGNGPLNDSATSGYSLGELSVSMDSSTSASSMGYTLLCPMAMMYLRDAYLLYRGLRHGRL